MTDVFGCMGCAEHLNNRKGAYGCRLSDADNSLSSNSKGLLALVWGTGPKCEESAASTLGRAGFELHSF